MSETELLDRRIDRVLSSITPYELSCVCVIVTGEPGPIDTKTPDADDVWDKVSIDIASEHVRISGSIGLIEPSYGVTALASALRLVGETSGPIGAAVLKMGAEDCAGIANALGDLAFVPVVGIVVTAAPLHAFDVAREALSATGRIAVAYDGAILWTTRNIGQTKNGLAEALSDEVASKLNEPGEAVLRKRVRVLSQQLEIAQARFHDVTFLPPVNSRVAERRLIESEGRALARVHELEQSTSWRVTAGPRLVKTLLTSASERFRSLKQPSIETPKEIEVITAPAGLSSADDSLHLERRLRVVAEALDIDTSGHLTSAEALQDAAPDTPGAWWLIHIGYLGAPPDDAELSALVEPARKGRADVATARLRSLRAAHRGEWQTTRPLRLISTTVLDASFACTTTLHTGVQRVVRNAAPHWFRLGLEPIVLDSAARAWRTPSEEESDRLLRWGSPSAGSALFPTSSRRQIFDEVIVPWGATVMVPELRPPEDIPILRTAARHSSNRFSAIVYDMIPITTAEHMSPGVVSDFGGYLSMIKYFHRVSAISKSAAAEFSGFGASLAAQGLSGPEISTHALPMVSPPEPTGEGVASAIRARTNPRLPLFLHVASISSHKNQAAVLAAAVNLWESGLDFELMFVAPNILQVGDFRNNVDHQRKLGRAVTIGSRIAESTLWQLYRDARAVLLPSLVEGYGLPIVEALSVGTPFISSNFGSMAEVAAGGGGMLVSPHDYRELAAAMRTALTDEVEYRRLRAEAAARMHDSWENYAVNVASWLSNGSLRGA